MRIELKNIGKKFQKKWLFRNVHEVFQSPEVVGIIGNNGSGKSTYTQLISGFLTPSEGEVIWHNGRNLAVEELWRCIAWCSPLLEMPGALSVIEVMKLYFQMREVEEKDVSQLLNELQLASQGGKKLEDLSSGMIQRLKLQLAFNTRAPILILDEPASHLDQHWQSWMDDKIKQCAQSKLIFIASNQHPVELKRCTRIINLNPHAPLSADH